MDYRVTNKIPIAICIVTITMVALVYNIRNQYEFVFKASFQPIEVHFRHFRDINDRVVHMDKPRAKTFSRQHFIDLHAKMIRPLSDVEKARWIDDIWKTFKMESHAELERVDILHWFDKAGARRELESKKIQFGGDDRTCGECFVTVDKSKEKTVDAIVVTNGPLLSWLKHGGFQGQKSENESPHPNMTDRNLEQFWVFQNKESGIKGSEEPNIITREIDSLFNLTISYRRDSDIIRYFGEIENSIRVARLDLKSGRLLQEDDEYFQQMMEKKVPYGGQFNAAWFVSNCNHTTGALKRWEFGKSLIKAGLKLYGEGHCFDKVTTRNFGKSAKKTDLSKMFQLDTMKFYLAFENAFHCNDYVSEKFWRNSFGSNLVPVVYGPHPDDVSAIAPPNSFIHSEFFDSPEELTGYLNFLDSNDTAYLDYHQWKTLYPAEVRTQKITTLGTMGNDERTMCELCRLVRESRKKNHRQYYQSVMKFWHYDVYPECKEDVKFQQYQTAIDQNIITF